MKNKVFNEVTLEGLLYEHKLEKKVSGPTSANPGTEFINGTLSIATDDDCLNVVQVHFTYVTALTAKGNPNRTYTTLSTIIDKGHCVTTDGAENATKLRISTTIALNEFYRNIEDEDPVSVPRNEGGFVHIVNGALNEDKRSRNHWEADMVITKISDIEEDPERGIKDEVKVSGLIFNNYTKAVMPMSFSALSNAAKAYFRKLEVSSREPLFTKLWGEQVSQTVSREIREESAFGEASVRIQNSSVKKYVITGMSPDGYPWGDADEGISVDEIKSKLADRELYLASMKKRQAEYQNSRNAAAKPMAAKSSNGDYDF